MSTMSEKPVRLGQREQSIVELLLQGCDNDEIARQLKMAPRTVKAHFNRLFLRFGISGGIKRVKLATMLYRKQLFSETIGQEIVQKALSADSTAEVVGTASMAEETRVSRELESPAASSSHALEHASEAVAEETDQHGPHESDVLEAWEHSLLGLDELVPQERRTAK
jgi:DNA-binding CsgD family transcriptional regulator